MYFVYMVPFDIPATEMFALQLSRDSEDYAVSPPPLNVACVMFKPDWT